MAIVLSRAEAAARLVRRVAERDQIQANLLELDDSLGKRLLAGASLTGITKTRWEAAAADLAWIFEAFAAYAAVLQRASDLLDGVVRPNSQRLAEVTALLTEPSVVVTGVLVPIAERKLTRSGQPRERLSLTEAVDQMTPAFTRIAEVVEAAERVWNEVSQELDELELLMRPAMPQAEGPEGDALSGVVGGVDVDLRRMRALLSSDPLSLWRDGSVDATELDQLRRRAEAAAERALEINRLREDAKGRIAKAAAAVAATQAREDDARAARAAAEEKIAIHQLAPLPRPTSTLSDRLAELEDLRRAGNWRRLATELAAVETECAAAVAQWAEAERAARALVDRRDELRGLLGAYQAKAGRLGEAENADLAAQYRIAQDVLWSAPCDLAAATEAVRRYQEAILWLQGGGG